MPSLFHTNVYCLLGLLTLPHLPFHRAFFSTASLQSFFALSSRHRAPPALILKLGLALRRVVCRRGYGNSRLHRASATGGSLPGAHQEHSRGSRAGTPREGSNNTTIRRTRPATLPHGLSSQGFIIARWEHNGRLSSSVAASLSFSFYLVFSRLSGTGERRRIV